MPLKDRIILVAAQIISPPSLPSQSFGNGQRNIEHSTPPCPLVKGSSHSGSHPKKICASSQRLCDPACYTRHGFPIFAEQLSGRVPPGAAHPGTVSAELPFELPVKLTGMPIRASF